MKLQLAEAQRTELLDLLRHLTRRSGVTAGAFAQRIREPLRRSLQEKLDLSPGRLTSGVMYRILHGLWREGRVAAEPPTGPRSAVRFWHPDHLRGRAADGGGLPSRRFSTEAEDAESHFKQSLCGLIVEEWKNAAEAETREVLERLLRNAGAEPSEAEGSVVSFKGRRHACESPLLPGDSVKVLRSGWVLRRSPGEMLLTKSFVEAV